MKFALLIAAVSAISISSNGPNTGEDWSHHYTKKLDAANQKVDDASNKEIAQREAVKAEQAAKDAWRAKFDDRYAD